MYINGGLAELLAASSSPVVAIVLLCVGLVLLLLGIRLVRTVAALGFAITGGLLGLLIAGQYSEMRLAVWSSAAGGAVLIGLVGFFLYRFWAILAFGALLGVAGSIGYVMLRAPGEVHQVFQQARGADQSIAAAQAGDASAGGALADRPDADRLPSATRILSTWSAARAVIGQHPLGMSLSCLGGLVVGLLLGGFAYKLAAVLLSSVWGLLLVVVGLWLIVPAGLVDNVRAMGAKAWLGPAGLWLVGLAVQGLLARGKAKSPDSPGEPSSR